MDVREMPTEIQEISVLQPDVDALIEKYWEEWWADYRATQPQTQPVYFHHPIKWDVDYTGYFKDGMMRVIGGEAVIDSFVVPIGGR